MTEEEFIRLQCQAYGHRWQPLYREVSITALAADETAKLEPILANCVVCGQKWG